MSVAMELWDWRRRIGELYAAVRAAEDPQAAWMQWRTARDTLFATHPQTPLEPAARQAFRGVSYFAYDPALRFLAELEAIAGPAEQFPAGAETVTLQPFARTVGLAARLGGELTLYWITGYGGGVFLPFGDAGNGRESYGGGRYLLDGIKGADLGTLGARAVLDFNFSYYPSCAYSDRWTCPLAPATNRLSAVVTAGERN